jgi:hypothetical protein
MHAEHELDALEIGGECELALGNTWTDDELVVGNDLDPTLDFAAGTISVSISLLLKEPGLTLLVGNSRSDRWIPF